MTALIDVDNLQGIEISDIQVKTLREYFESGKLATYEFVCGYPTCRWDELVDVNGDIILEPSDAYDDARRELGI